MPHPSDPAAISIPASDKVPLINPEIQQINPGFLRPDAWLGSDCGHLGERKMHSTTDSSFANRLGRVPTPAIAIFSIVAIAAFVLSLLYWASDGDFGTFVHWPSAAFVLALPLMILMAVFSWAAPIDALLYATGHRNEPVVAKEAAQFFQLWAALALACGFIGTVIGLVVMLANLDDPGKLGPGMAVALLSQLYGVCIAVVCIVSAVVILRRHPDSDATQRLNRQAVAGAGISVVAGTMATLIAFGILMLAFMHAA